MPTTNSAQNLITLKLLLITLNKTPLSQYEIADKLGLPRTTIWKWLKHLKSSYPNNLVYIEEYRRVCGRGPWTAIWAFGIGKQDAIKPRRLTSAEYNKNWRKRKKRSDLITTNLDKGVITHVSHLHD